MVREYRERRDYLMGARDDLGFTYGHPGGAFYIYADTIPTGLDAERFCLTMLREARVIFLPGTRFGDPHGRHIGIGTCSRCRGSKRRRRVCGGGCRRPQRDGT